MSSYTLSNTLDNIKVLLGMYCIKYMYALRNTSKNAKSFQNVLLRISQWNETTIQKEYKKFLKWTKKRKTAVFEHQVRLYVGHKICFLTKQTWQLDIDYAMLFYKCIKAIAKLFYKNPKDIYSISGKKVMKLIQKKINSLIPLDKIFELVEANYEPSTVYSYQIDEEENHSISPKPPNPSEINLINSRKDNNNQGIIQLKYIPSEEYFNEYYQSESDASTTKNIKDIVFKKK
jgi:hypothetical protein